MNTQEISTDYLVIGSGLAGLYFALQVAEKSKVCIVTKKKPTDSSSDWAQGGIAAVLGEDDSLEKHVADTLRVGDGLCNSSIVESTIAEGPSHIQRFLDYGVPFDRDKEGKLDLTREGGHCERRVAHAKDTTGHAIHSTLLRKVKAHPNIQFFSHHMAIDLLSMAKYGGEPACFGAYVLDCQTGDVATFVATATVLASGGSGKVYVYTSNPDVASGDGVAMAYRIGAQITNMEFVQFHPTVLYHPHAKSFLISETLRGEGGILKRPDGSPFMENYHPRKSLGPRDVVARAIDNEIKISGASSMFLDMTHLDDNFVRERFPSIANRCLQLGIDITKSPIPVVPAAHYQCGGVDTDSNGQTSIRNLFAIGECAHTGLHGACRLASNSLLEGAVFASRAAEKIAECEPYRPQKVVAWSPGDASRSKDAIVVSLNWEEVRRFMWSYVGIVRSDKRIERARRRIELLREEITEYYWDHQINSDIVELRNLALTAHLVVESARRRKESRGLHYTLDYPEKKEPAHNTHLQQTNGPPI